MKTDKSKNQDALIQLFSDWWDTYKDSPDKWNRNKFGNLLREKLNEGGYFKRKPNKKRADKIIKSTDNIW